MTRPLSEAETRPLATAAELLASKVASLLRGRLAALEAADDAAELPPPPSDPQLERRLAGAEGRAWSRLIELFALTQAEADLLMLSVAVAAEPALGPVVARAQGAEGRLLPTEALAKRLGGHGARPIWRPTSPLSLWGLMTPVRWTPGEPTGFEADPRIVDWLFRTLALDRALLLAADTPRAGAIPPEWPVRETAARLEHASQAGGPVRLLIEGRPGSGRRGFAAAVARALGREALVVDPAVLPPTDWAECFMRAQRFALYADLALVWREGSQAWPAKIPMAPLQFVCVGEGMAAPAREGAADLTVHLPEPGRATKAAIWATLAPHLAEAGAALAATPGLSLGDLVDAGRAAPRSVEEAGEQLRARARARLQGVGRAIDPRFDWDDLVLPGDVLGRLRRVAFEARHRADLLEDAEAARLFAGAAGLSALFAGPPGVGKSMAAQVIARDLGVNLLVIDLATTTSKFIGETAKNLSIAFARARAAGAALIFEEADALFARRTEVKESNDRHANADTGHLLQLMEAHDGLVILSTNRRANIDPAFIRRLRHVVEFPRPGAAERLRLWRTMLTALGAAATDLEADLARLATTHELSPAQIKSAALSARYAALAETREIRVSDIEAAAASELVKEGRAAPPTPTLPRRPVPNRSPTDA